MRTLVLSVWRLELWLRSRAVRRASRGTVDPVTTRVVAVDTVQRLADLDVVGWAMLR